MHMQIIVWWKIAELGAAGGEPPAYHYSEWGEVSTQAQPRSYGFRVYTLHSCTQVLRPSLEALDKSA